MNWEDSSAVSFEDWFDPLDCVRVSDFCFLGSTGQHFSVRGVIDGGVTGAIAARVLRASSQ